MRNNTVQHQAPQDVAAEENEFRDNVMLWSFLWMSRVTAALGAGWGVSLLHLGGVKVRDEVPRIALVGMPVCYVGFAILWGAVISSVPITLRRATAVDIATLGGWIASMVFGGLVGIAILNAAGEKTVVTLREAELAIVVSESTEWAIGLSLTMCLIGIYHGVYQGWKQCGGPDALRGVSETVRQLRRPLIEYRGEPDIVLAMSSPQPEESSPQMSV
ncbi:MAG: hypothetical protein A3J38_05515 [Gammaproteobacteria bacterium RIFCSPHIGHO2_12_FULL_45_9]|nr:MAG: hypothetical protein A3J38_05515 [Gammaproteobacteria bacterium RIFCSPHIGHO2_12_FULL_45_9]